MKFEARLSTALPRPLYDALQEYARQELVSPSTAVRQAVAFFLTMKAGKTSTVAGPVAVAAEMPKREG